MHTSAPRLACSAAAAAAAACLLLATPLAAQEDDAPAHHVPEPMVFDLVRSLGARAGELEANALALVPLHGRGDVLWAPEIEWAPIDDLALEVELPMTNTQVEAWKVAAQYTFGRADAIPLFHGAQVIGEHLLHDRALELTGLYLLSLRFDARWSLSTMTGLRFALPFADSQEQAHEFIQNITCFYTLSSHISLGLEGNAAHAAEGGTASRAIAQIHWQAADHLMLQLGAGAAHEAGSTTPYLGARFILAR